MTIKELLEYAQHNLDTWISDPVLWDLSNATMTEEKSDHAAVTSLVNNIHSMVEKRRGEKTIFVAPDPFTYGMLRMAISIVEWKESCFIASVFADIKEAKIWLKESRTLSIQSTGRVTEA